MTAKCEDEEEAAAAPPKAPGNDEDEADAVLQEMPRTSQEAEGSEGEGMHQEPDATAPKELIGCEYVAITGGANLTKGTVLDEGVLIIIG